MLHVPGLLLFGSQAVRVPVAEIRPRLGFPPCSLICRNPALIPVAAAQDGRHSWSNVNLLSITSPVTAQPPGGSALQSMLGSGSSSAPNLPRTVSRYSGFVGMLMEPNHHLLSVPHGKAPAQQRVSHLVPVRLALAGCFSPAALHCPAHL